MKISSVKLYFYILFFSIAFIIVGNRIALMGTNVPHEERKSIIRPVIVTQIIDTHTIDSSITFITFSGRTIVGESRGITITAQQTVSEHAFFTERRAVEVDDWVLLFYDSFGERYVFMNYMRIHYIAILSAVFLFLIVLFGRTRGFNAIVSLGLTCAAMFWVFVPAILSGHNIYITTFVICVYIIISSLLISIGFNKKAFAAILGCLGGVFLSGLLMIFMDDVLNLTGFADEEASFLLMQTHFSISDLRSITFAGVTIGAVGAIMDVAMSISSSLWEICNVDKKFNSVKLFRSGLNIGKDILGTMLNTLILAYIGSSISFILLVNLQATSMMALLNAEIVIIEILRSLIGSFGMFLTIPLTAAICSWLYGIREKY